MHVISIIPRPVWLIGLSTNPAPDDLAQGQKATDQSIHDGCGDEGEATNATVIATLV